MVATGETHTVREFIELAGRIAGFDLVWEGTGLDEKGRDRRTGKVVIEIDSRFFRPAEVDLLLGNPAKAKRLLGWEPRVRFHELVEIMMNADLKEVGAR